MRGAAVLVLALAALAGCSGGEPPASGPRGSATTDPPADGTTAPPDTGGTEVRIGYAGVFLTGAVGTATEVFVPFDVFAPPDQEPFGRGEFFVLGYECLTDGQVPATVEGLDSATAAGTLPLTCGFHGDGVPPGPAEVIGTATVDLAWTGEGPVTEQDLGGPDSTCTGRLQIRHAQVAGSARLQVPALAVDVTATPPGDDDDAIRHERSTCTSPPD